MDMIAMGHINENDIGSCTVHIFKPVRHDVKLFRSTKQTNDCDSQREKPRGAHQYSYVRRRHSERAEKDLLTRCTLKTRTAGGRPALKAAASAVPSGSHSNASGTHSIFSATTVDSECTFLSVRLLRVHFTWGDARVDMCIRVRRGCAISVNPYKVNQP